MPVLGSAMLRFCYVPVLFASGPVRFLQADGSRFSHAEISRVGRHPQRSRETSPAESADIPSRVGCSVLLWASHIYCSVLFWAFHIYCSVLLWASHIYCSVLLWASHIYCSVLFWAFHIYCSVLLATCRFPIRSGPVRFWNIRRSGPVRFLDLPVPDPVRSDGS